MRVPPRFAGSRRWVLPLFPRNSGIWRLGWPKSQTSLRRYGGPPANVASTPLSNPMFSPNSSARSGSAHRPFATLGNIYSRVGERKPRERFSITMPSSR